MIRHTAPAEEDINQRAYCGRRIRLKASATSLLVEGAAMQPPHVLVT